MKVNKEKINQSQQDFVSLAAHQLRSPLSSSRWFVNLLMSGKAGALNPEQHYLVENLDDVLKHISEVVEVLLRLGRIESGKIKIQPKPSDLNEITQSVIASLKPIADKNNISLNFHSSEQSPVLVPVDSEFIWQTMEILLSNAIKYSKEAGMVEVNVEYRQDKIQVSVKDGGIGIPKDEQANIFEKFYRAKNASVLIPQGSGLGLSLAKSLVQAWGGEIFFKSEEGKGSLFSFNVPKTGVKAKEGQNTLTA